MRQLLAILGDSWRETADRKSLYVLLLLALLPILFCLSLGFETRPFEAVIEEQASDLDTFRYSRRHMSIDEGHDVDYSVREVRAFSAATDARLLPDAPEDSWVVDLDFAEPSELERLRTAWIGFTTANADEDAPPAATAGEFLEQRFRAFGWQHVTAAELEPGRWAVAVATDYPHEVADGFEATVGFGLAQMPVPGTTLAEFVVQLQVGLAGLFVGFIGLIVALSACGSFVPDMLQKGTLDLVLARPISRTKLLLGKYLGGLWFVACLATFTIGGCWLALTIGSGYASPWFLASIPTMVFAFAVLYAVSVLVGVLTRSAGIATLVALAVWFLSSIVAGLRAVPATELGLPKWVADAVALSYAVLPKLEDLDTLTTTLLARAHLSDAARARMFSQLPEVDWWFSLGTTTLFAAAVLALAVWVFRRRDH